MVNVAWYAIGRHVRGEEKKPVVIFSNWELGAMEGRFSPSSEKRANFGQYREIWSKYTIKEESHSSKNVTKCKRNSISFAAALVSLF